MLLTSLTRVTFSEHPHFRAHEEKVYRDMIRITKLPPGKAIGADDLQNWSRQRNAGRSGTRDDRLEEKRLRKQKRWREKRLLKHRRKYPRKGLADIAFEEAIANKNN